MARRGLDREIITTAALELIDRDGLDALTMRALGAELGVEAPSLYKHVSGKDDIIEGVMDLVYASVRVGASDAPWQQRVHDYSNALRWAMLAHPHVAPLIANRPVLGAATLELVEDFLQEASDVGFDVQDSLYVVDTIASYIIGHVLAQLAINPDVGDDPEAIARIRALLPADRYPRVVATLGSGPVDRDREFTFGLNIIVAGLERLLELRGAEAIAGDR